MLVLLVGHLLLYHPAIQRLKGIVDDGTIGRMYYLYSQRLNLGIVRQEENALWSLAPHDVSVALHLIDSSPIQVSAFGQSFLRPDVHDVVFMNILFDDGAIAHVHVSWLDPHKTRKFTLVGSEKMAVFDDMESSEKIRLYDKGATFGTYNKYGDFLNLRFGDIVIPTLEMTEPLVSECTHFIDSVRANRQPLSDGANGVEVVELLYAAQRSLDNAGAPVQVEGVRT